MLARQLVEHDLAMEVAEGGSLDEAQSAAVGSMSFVLAFKFVRSCWDRTISLP